MKQHSISRRRIALGALGTPAVLAMSACGGGGDDGSPDIATAVSATTASTSSIRTFTQAAANIAQADSTLSRPARRGVNLVSPEGLTARYFLLTNEGLKEVTARPPKFDAMSRVWINFYRNGNFIAGDLFKSGLPRESKADPAVVDAPNGDLLKWYSTVVNNVNIIYVDYVVRNTFRMDFGAGITASYSIHPSVIPLYRFPPPMEFGALLTVHLSYPAGFVGVRRLTFETGIPSSREVNFSNSKDRIKIWTTVSGGVDTIHARLIPT